MKRLVALLLLAAVPALAGAQEAAAPRPADPTAHRHLGFFLRPELGLSFLSTSASQGGVDVKVKGSGAGLGLAIGGAVSENFIVAGQVWDYVATKPDVTVSGSGLSLSGTADGDAGLVGYGVLLNWYLMPSNVYLAVTPSLTRLVSTDGSTSSTSDWGVGLRGAVGIEWWVSDHWGLGLAGSLAFSSNKDSGGSGAPTWGTAAFGLSFSATYN